MNTFTSINICYVLNSHQIESTLTAKKGEKASRKGIDFVKP